MTTVATTLDERIRIRAYHLWEANGRPQGRDKEFWERARELIATEDSPEAGRRPGPAKTAEPSEAAQNSDGVPDRFTGGAGKPQAPGRRRQKKT